MNEQRQPLTPKEIKLVKGIAEGKTKQAAAMAAYDASTPESASSIASQTLKKLNVQEALAEAFAAHGITIDAATKPIADGLKATRNTGGEDGFEVADHSVRLKASGMAFNLMGVGRQTGDVTINFVNQAVQQRGEYEI